MQLNLEQPSLEPLNVVKVPVWDLRDERWTIQAEAMMATFLESAHVHDYEPFEYEEQPHFPRSCILPQGQNFPGDIPGPSFFQICSWAELRYATSRNPVNWDELSEDLMLWFGGQFDGDGCIMMSPDHTQTAHETHANSAFTMIISKAQNSWSTLYFLERFFGGAVHEGVPQKGNQQAVRHWKISGGEAYDLAWQASDYTRIKQAQLNFALEYRIGINNAKKSAPVISFNETTKEVKYYSSVIACEEDGVKRQQVHKVLRGEKQKAGNLRWARVPNPVTYAIAKAHTDHYRNLLRHLKQDPHGFWYDPHGAYFAGFIDADGCLYLGSQAKKVYSVAQKWPDICYAFQRAFGGHVRKVRNRQLYVWNTGTAAQRMQVEQNVFPFLIEKFKQGQIILEANPANWAVKRTELSALKGHQLHLQQAPEDLGDIEAEEVVDIDWYENLLEDGEEELEEINNH